MYRPRTPAWLLWTVGIICGITIIVIFFVAIAAYVAPQNVSERTTLVQVLAQVSGALGLILTFALTARQVVITREGQITDRYTKAIEQLGSDKAEIRLGGIYALERIARDSRRDHHPAMEVLATFVRDRTRPPIGDPAAFDTPSDVRAALTVIGRRDRAERDEDMPPPNLIGIRAPKVELHKAKLIHVTLSSAYLEGASLRDAHLSFADLHEITLDGANLTNAHLQRADLSQASFTNTILDNADLRDVDLRGATGLTAQQLAGTKTNANTHMDPDLDRDLKQLRAQQGARLTGGP